MSLRGLRYLPNVPKLGGALKSMGNLPVLGSMRQLPRTEAFPSSNCSSCLRMVHTTPKNDSTVLFGSDAKYDSLVRLSLKTLKSECRNRGLKISGRKSELISRVVAFDTRKLTQLSTANNKLLLNIQREAHSRRQGNGKPVKISSNYKGVDKVKLPNIAATEDAISHQEKDYIVKIPTLTKEAAAKTELASHIDTENNIREDFSSSLIDREGAISSPDSDVRIQTPIAAINKVEIINEEAEREDLDYYDQKKYKKSSQSDFNEPNSLTARDKKFLSGFAVAVLFWWYMGNEKDRR